VSYSGQPPAGGPATGGRPEPPQNIATALADVSQRAADLVHEEIELFKAELSEKVNRYIRGAVVGVVAGVFVLMAVILALVGGAWLFYWGLPVETYAYFWGFFAMAAVLLLLGAMFGLFAGRLMKRVSPPVPTMAIDEARKIGETMRSGSDAQLAAGPGPGAGAHTGLSGTGDGGPPPPAAGGSPPGSAS
jgi:MFS family permease